MKASLVLLLALGRCAYPQSPGAFTTAGNMMTPRVFHTATLLSSGKVLIAGGIADASITPLPVSSAELYDPPTGAFTATGRMTTARYSHTATLLPDGRVLIAGGDDGDGDAVLGAEVYDPSTGTFTGTGSMTFAHTAATLLKTGKVLMTLPTKGNPEVYDPSSGAFQAARGYAGATGGSFATTATLLADGRVLIAAGTPPFGLVHDPHPISAQIFDPADGVFSLTGAMVDPDANNGRSATLLTDGRVLFTGGERIADPYPYADYDADAELYDPYAGSFAASGNLIQRRSAHTATLLPDGTVLITGGLSINPQSAGFYDFLQSAELYDSRIGTFSFAGNMETARDHHVATLLNDGTVLITGGTQHRGAVGVPIPSAELYTPPVLVPAPLLFAGAIWHAATGQVVSDTNPAVAGEALSMYTTSLVEGGVIPPQVVIGGRVAQILFFGSAPGLAGISQVNVRVPSGVTPGSAVPVRLTYIGRPSNEVTIGMK